MSNAAMSCAWEADDRPRTSGALFVLVVLADHASDHSGENWGAFPSVGRICERTELRRGAVERHLKTLEETGWITRKRRVRPDGRLGIYDYVVHRRAEERASLRQIRAAAEAFQESFVLVGEYPADVIADGPDPCSKMEHGPCVILEPAMLHFDDQPCSKLEHHEPPLEPSTEPSTAGASEPGDEGFEEAIGAWPKSGQKRTKWPAGRAAWALRCGELGRTPMLDAVKACARDPVLGKGDFGWPGLDVWLTDERFRAFLPVETARRTAFVGPAAMLAEVEALDPAAAACLEQAAWPAEGALQPATRWAFDRLRHSPQLREVITRHGFKLIEPGFVTGGTPS